MEVQATEGGGVEDRRDKSLPADAHGAGSPAAVASPNGSSSNRLDAGLDNDESAPCTSNEQATSGTREEQARGQQGSSSSSSISSHSSSLQRDSEAKLDAATLLPSELETSEDDVGRSIAAAPKQSASMPVIKIQNSMEESGSSRGIRQLPLSMPRSISEGQVQMGRGVGSSGSRGSGGKKHWSAAKRRAIAEKFLWELQAKAALRDDYKVDMSSMRFNLEQQQQLLEVFQESEYEGELLPEKTHDADAPIPKLTIAILIVGTRGDVQPFVAIGKELKRFGHRVRLASHANYRDFVTSEGLEFYPLGGDPKVLAEYMVRNKGFLPSGAAEVHLQRKQLRDIIMSTWPACTEPDTEPNSPPFKANAIIANPPTAAHLTVAEKLQVPLHVFFTMPWTPTDYYPHPLAYVPTHITGHENKLSYTVVDTLMWVGMKDLLNELRKKLKLPRYGTVHGPRVRIPYGYIWSPSLAPKAADWSSLVDVVGFCFLNLASNFSPPSDLDHFLSSGPPPIFVGFGSLPVEDPKGMTEIVVQAIKATGQRGIIQKGWGGLGEVDDCPEDIFVIGNCPHDWLFPKCSAVVHHGGAGTTAAGLKAGCPTTIVPFFGDQSFWGSRVAACNVGPAPIHVEHFSLPRLTAAIRFMMQDEVQQSARLMASVLAEEDGVKGAVDAFHKHLPPGFDAGGKDMPWLIDPNPSFTSCCDVRSFGTFWQATWLNAKLNQLGMSRTRRHNRRVKPQKIEAPSSEP